MTSSAASTAGRQNGKFDKKTLFRQWRLLNILGSREQGVTLQELSAELQTSQRTIQRDLDLLTSVGFPLQSTTGPHGRKHWRRLAGEIPSINLNLTEAASIYLSRKLMEPLAGTDLWVGAQEAYQKFQCAFDKRTLKYLDKLAQAFHATRFGTGDYSTYGETIDTLMISIEDHKVVTLSYQSQRTTEPAERDVHPYHLIYHRGTLYLVAYAVEHSEFRNYKVDRISSAVADPKSLPFVPLKFDLETYLAGSFGIYQGHQKPTTVRVLFHPPVVRYVLEKHWHDSEKLTKQPDGTLLAEFQLTDFHELTTWLLSFGPQAEILEPPSLRKEIATTIQAMNQIYTTPAPTPHNKEVKRKQTPK